MKDTIINVCLVLVLLVAINMVLQKPQIKTNIVEESTSKLEADIKNEEQLEDHYVIYDDGKENSVAKGAKVVSQCVEECIRFIVILIGDFFSMMLTTYIK